MYVYFDNLGNLKEIVNDKVFRVGNSNYNEIYVYIDKQNYDNVSGITTTYYLPDGDKSVEAYTINIVEAQIPFNKKRDLKFFEYFKTYKFFKIVVPDTILSEEGAVRLEIKAVNASEEIIYALGQVAFMVDGTSSFRPDENINIAQWNSLLIALAGRPTIEQVANNYLPKNQILPQLHQFTRIDSEHKATFDFNLEGEIIGIFTFGNCFSLIPLYQIQPNTIYKTNGTFVYDDNGNVVSTMINYRWDNESDILEIWSGNRNYSFMTDYTAYLFTIKGGQ